MRWIRFAVLVTIVSLLQAGAIGIFEIKDVRPNLLLVLMVFFAVYSSTYDAIITSFIIGFAADIIGMGTVGVGMLSYGIAGTLLGYLHGVVQIRKFFYQAFTIFAVSMLTGILIIILNSLINQPASQLTSFFCMSVYSAVIGPFFFLPFSWIVGVKYHQS